MTDGTIAGTFRSGIPSEKTVRWKDSGVDAGVLAGTALNGVAANGIARMSAPWRLRSSQTRASPWPGLTAAYAIETGSEEST